MAQQQAADRPLRNVFVGNIPYDATEEKLREIFTTVGPVLSFRLVYDRETGKPKGYGFCEYKDQETAASAIRNLNGYDINGRQLRVDSASDVRERGEEPNTGNATGASTGPQVFHEPSHSNEVEPVEAINKVVASLPPEQMFELAKQMKQTIQTNPNEARAMLIQNPQLVYALLQALVVMRSIDPQTAMSILHKQMAQQIPVANFIQAGTIMTPAQPTQMVPVITNVMPGLPMQQPNIGPQPTSMHQSVQGIPIQVPIQQGVPGQQIIVPNLGPAFNQQPYSSQGIPLNPASIQPVSAVSNAGMIPMNPTQAATPTSAVQSNDPRLARGRGSATSNQAQQQQSAQQQAPQQQQQQHQQQQQNIQMSEQQKAELIMQVLQMTNDQIAQLPPDQQQKIFMLREQIRAQGGPNMA